MSVQETHKSSRAADLLLPDDGLTRTLSLFSLAMDLLEDGDTKAAREAANECRKLAQETDQEIPPGMRFFYIRLEVKEGRLGEDNVVDQSRLKPKVAAHIAAQILEAKQASEEAAWALAYQLYEEHGIAAYKVAAVAIIETELEGNRLGFSQAA